MTLRLGLAARLVVLFPVACSGPAGTAEPVQVRSGIDHAEWDRLLRTYVDERGLVDYGAWKASPPDRRALEAYLARLAAEPTPAAQEDDRAASLINAYNALTIRWVLHNYPTKSIMALPQSFGTARHLVGGKQVSLDAIEHGALRPLVGYRIHAALVCAARSCPPLAREGYRADRLDEQLDAATARWLSREDLNRFFPGKAELSEIFKWFAPDFEKAGGIRSVLKRHGPPSARTLLEAGDPRIEYLPYDWSLNDRAGRAGTYGRLRLIRDRILDALH